MHYRLTFNYKDNHKIWGDVVVVYHPPSGNTFTLTLLSHDVLSMMCRSGDFNDIFNQLSEVYPENSKADLKNALNKIIDSLLVNQLVDPLPIDRTAHAQ